MDLIKVKKEDNKSKISLYKTINSEKNSLECFIELLSNRGKKPSITSRSYNCKNLKKYIPSKKYLNAIQKGLYYRYSNKEGDYDRMILDSLLYNKNTHVVSVFKDHMILDYVDEFLKRIYKIEEANERIPKIANYYKNYLKFFCKPLFRDFGINEIIQSYGDYKAELYYNKNYGGKNKNVKNDDNDNIKKIFDTTVRKNIDHNSLTRTTIKMDNTISSARRHHLDSFRDKLNESLLTLNSIIHTGRSNEDSIVHYLSMLDKNKTDKKQLNYKKLQPEIIQKEKIIKVNTSHKVDTKSQDFDLKKSDAKNLFKYVPGQSKSSSVQKTNIISPVLNSANSKFTKLKITERTKTSKDTKTVTQGSFKLAMKNSNILENKRPSNSELYGKDKNNNINITDLMKITLSVCVDKSSRNKPYSKHLSSNSNTMNTGTFNILDSARKSTTIINKVDSINNFNININNPIISESIHSTLLNMKDKKTENVLSALLEKNKTMSRNKNTSIYKMATVNPKEERKDIERIFSSYNSKILII
jgi:hypothetical protein